MCKEYFGSAAPRSKATAVDFMNSSDDEEDGEVKAINGGRPVSGRGRGRHLTQPAWMSADLGGSTNLAKTKGINVCAKSTSGRCTTF